MMKTWAIMHRDLLKLSRNPLTIFTTVILPIIYLVIFGNSFQGVLKNLPLAVVSQDSGKYALRVMEQMQALQAGPKYITVTYIDDPAEAIREVRNGHFKAALIIPHGFSSAIVEGRIGELGLFTDNVDTISSADLEGLISQATASLRDGYVTARAQAQSNRVQAEQPFHHR
jgi:ABC-2 type transport system permease protein